MSFKFWHASLSQWGNHAPPKKSLLCLMIMFSRLSYLSLNNTNGAKHHHHLENYVKKSLVAMSKLFECLSVDICSVMVRHNIEYVVTSYFRFKSVLANHEHYTEGTFWCYKTRLAQIHKHAYLTSQLDPCDRLITIVWTKFESGKVVCFHVPRCINFRQKWHARVPPKAKQERNNSAAT